MPRRKTTESRMSMLTEPIRLPALLVALWAIVAVPVIVAVLTGADWRPVLAGAIVLTPPLLGYAESKRARTDSPATIKKRQEWQPGE